jgi:hypothetical protein
VLMSATANWSYTETATVKPFAGRDQWTGASTYGTEYTIACTFTADIAQFRSGADSAEFVAQHTIFTEDARPQKLDMIQFDGSNGWEEIREIVKWDMSFFDEFPDYKILT